MSELTIAVKLTKPGVLGPGEAATGLTLSDILIYVVEQDRAGGVGTLVLNGVNPTAEQPSVGIYTYTYAAADLDLYNYYAYAQYTGAVTLDQYYIGGMAGNEEPGAGSPGYKFWPYQVTLPDLVTPVPGATVWVTADSAGTIMLWTGITNATGWAKKNNQDPLLPLGTVYIWKFLAGYVDLQNPDTEVVA